MDFITIYAMGTSLFSATTYLPIIVGLGFIVIGLLFIVLPTPSLLKLDKGVNSWVYEDRNQHHRIGVVIASYKALGGFFSVSGLVYLLMTFARTGAI